MNNYQLTDKQAVLAIRYSTIKRGKHIARISNSKRLLRSYIDQVPSITGMCLMLLCVMSLLFI